MRVLVTGASGTLARNLLPLLEARGDAVVALDVTPPPGRGAVKGDVLRREDVAAAVSGVDIVVHAAAIHGIHLSTHSDVQFHELNVNGTFNVWRAAVSAGVRGVVFSSTMGVYGRSREPGADDEVVAVDETLPLLPADIYAYTKLVGEEMCRFHWRAHGVPSVALRFGMFVPETFFRYGIRLLYGGVHEEDAANAVVAAIDALARGTVEHEAFNVESRLPFDDADAPQLRRDPLAALERHFPGSRVLLAERGVRSLEPITERFVVDRAEQRLGFAPRHNFAEWLAELARRANERSDADTPWP